MRNDAIGKMFGITAILLALFLSSGPVLAYYQSVTPWPMGRYDSAHTASSPSSSPNSNAILWTAIGDSHWYGSAPTVAGGLVFVVNNGGTMFCFDETTGVQLWTQHLTGYFQGEPLIIDDRLYAGTNANYMYILNATNGVKLQEYQATPGFSGPTSPVAANGKVYFGSADGYLYALDANDFTPIWAYHAGSGIISSPAVDDTGVYFGCNDGKIYGLDTNGTKKWEFLTGYTETHPTWDSIYSSPSVADDMVFAGSSMRNHLFLAINKTSGASIWNYTLNDQVVPKSLAFSEGFVYCTAGNRVYKLLASASSGSYLETDPNIRKAVYDLGTEASNCAIAGGKLFVSSWGGVTYAMNKTSALSLIWSYNVGNYINAYSAPSVADGRVFVPTWGSGLICFGDPFPPVTSHYAVNAGGTSFDVAIETNSTVTNFSTIALETEKKISFGVAGIKDTTGMCNITIPNYMLDGELNVAVDGGQPLYSAPQLNNGTHTSLYFTYNGTIPHAVEITGTTVIPEFPVIPILPMLLATLLATLVQLKRKPSK